ncbi:zinc-dependent alcohol dehydrogenase family protein [Aquirufa sp. ROCK2-A2]
MKQVVFHQYGKPEDVLVLEECSKPLPQKGEALIRIKARNINPSDLMFIQGLYGIQAQLPSSAGFEAMGEIEEIEEGQMYPKGTRVMFTAAGTWKEYICLPVQQLIPVPKNMSDEVACQAFVNPITAMGMLESSGLQAGQYLIITAAASSWGKMVIQMAAQKGINVIGTIRNDEQKATLMDLGAKLIVNVEKENLFQSLKSLGIKGVDSIFDAVGGKLGAETLNCLNKGATMWVFGLLSLEPIPLNSGILIFKDLQIKGWWLSTWWENLAKEKRMQVIQELFQLLGSDQIRLDIDATFPLDQYKEALAAYQTKGRTGKILIC